MSRKFRYSLRAGLRPPVSLCLMLVALVASGIGPVHAQDTAEDLGDITDTTDPGTLEGTITLNPNEDDWFSFRLSNPRFIVVERVHGPETDADVCVYRDPVPIPSRSLEDCATIVDTNAILTLNTSEQRRQETGPIGNGKYYFRVTAGYFNRPGAYEFRYLTRRAPAVVLSETELMLAEGGAAGSYTVRLTDRPSQNLEVRISSDNDDVTVSPERLTFTPATWNVPQTVDVTAAQDADGDGDTATLSHTLMGYENDIDGGTVTVNVVDDDIAGVTVAPTVLSITEGGSGTYTVVLDTDPDLGRNGSTVTVTPTSNNADVTFAPASMTFTSSNWSISQTVTVSAARDDDADADEATITHEVAGYGDVTTAADVAVVVNEIGNAPGAPRNLTATPGDREVTLTWSPPLSDGGTPIIRYEYQVDGGAWSETDGPARHVVDGLTNGTQYRFAVRAINSVNEPEPGPGSTSALVSASPQAHLIEPVEQEAVTETVQAVAAATAANIAANIGTRFSASRSGSTVVVGGQALTGGPVPASAFNPIVTSRHQDPFREDDDFSRARSLDFDDLLRTSTFEVSLNAADEEAQGGGMAPQWTVWGRGDFQRFASKPERGSTFDGDLKSGYLGVDARRDDRWLFGMAASVTRTESDYGLGDGGGDGRLEVRMTGLHPYLRYAPDARSEFWSILGMGQGEIENERPGGSARETSDISMRMAAAGGRRALETDGAFGLAVLGDLGFARVETDDGTAAIQGITVDAWRARLGVEGSFTTLLESGYAVTTFAEVAGRYDGGEDEDEMGLEISPGVFVAGPNGIGFELRGRMLALHTAESYEEYGASMTVSVSPRPGGSGLSLSMSPRVGAATGSAETLWREDAFALSGARSPERDALSLDVGMGYGVRAMNGLLTPFGELSLWDEDTRRLRTGVRFGLTRSSLGALSLELSGERHDSEGQDPEHRVGVTGRLRF